MNRPLYFFNPEHDLALANSDRNFNAPLQAKKLAHDLAGLPLWYATPGSIVLDTNSDNNWLEEMQLLFPQLNNSQLTSAPDFSSITTLFPWGWDNVVCKHFSLLGADSALLPSTVQLEDIRRLSHRNISIRALEYIRQNIQFRDQLPAPAKELTSACEADEYASTHKKVIFKAPWSGSGKGLCWSKDKMTESRRGWCRNTIEKQGSVIAEPIYDKLLDFAMEFSCNDGETSFAGYSLFETDKGIYRGNFLMSDESIVRKIEGYGVPATFPLTIQNQLSTFITNNIAPFYTGLLGVDMFIYQENGFIKLHPCVEINLRMTMGCVARIFYDNFMNPDKTGRFYIDHYPSPGALFNDHLQRRNETPLAVTNGRISKGYISLTNITSHSHYRVRVEID
ncbi:hypothetical protein [Paludibacter jiangxiensis]|uniref:ATP-grasp domain-containing protein n=1 Tax=Paludibacter jiangxiensis TaxID=681398 RepID=A0A170Y5P9_9BACT|nr:hypothetical protein [Paludibacter jiangxiensis]GAT61538.1 hypothetical protein PJIAN_1118 [Paludibacter jiangxiensis]